MRALVAAGYQVYGVNPKQASRDRKGMSLSGAKSDMAQLRIDLVLQIVRQWMHAGCGLVEAGGCRTVSGAAVDGLYFSGHISTPLSCGTFDAVVVLGAGYCLAVGSGFGCGVAGL